MSIGSALATGASQFYAENLSEKGKANRADIQARKALAEQSLKETETLGDTKLEVATEELDVIKKQNKLFKDKFTRNETYSALDRYSADGDIIHLNTMLQDPGVKEKFPNAVRFDKLVEADMQAVARDMGPTEAVAYADSPELQKDLVKITMQDGSTKIGSMSQLAAVTGYTRYAGARERAKMKELAQIRRLGRGGATTAKERQAMLQVEQEGLDPTSTEGVNRYLEILTKLNEKAPGRGTKNEREAERLTRLEGIEDSDPGWDEAVQKNYEGIVAREARTTKQKDIIAGDQAIADIDELAGGEGKFLELDMSLPRNKRKYEQNIEKAEKLKGIEFSEQEKKMIASVKQLTTLGAPGAQLSSKETGIIDSMLFSARKYLTDNVTGVDTTSAYAALRNTIRHALYGSALTPGEAASFKEQFGSLKQQTGPVLAQFRVALEQVRANLESLSDTNNSYVMHYRLGTDKARLDEIIDALDERIDAFSGFIPVEQEQPSMSAKRAAELDSILGGVQ